MTQPRLLGGRYELDGVIGRGGMAEVHRARDLRLDRMVAVKTLRFDLARDHTSQARFRREAQSAASLNHPSIIAVYDTGEDMVDGLSVPYIIMEYVEGRTLKELLDDDRRLLPERAIELVEGILRALDYSHRNGIIHRDIKPANVMLTRQAEVKVMDFGIARSINDDQATMTQASQVIGTAQYLSPEQARGERVDTRSDLYSTGCVLYELLTCRPPFTGDSPVSIAYQHVREEPVPPSQVDPEVPGWIESIVLRSMAKDPDDRYQTAADMQADIQRGLSGMPTAASTMAVPAAAGATSMLPPVQDKRGYDDDDDDDDDRRGGGGQKALWALLVLAVLGSVIFAGWLVMRPSAEGTPVPDVAGMSVAEAESALQAEDFTDLSQEEKTSEDIEKGQVIGTDPEAGSSQIPAETPVTILVSSGPGEVDVPQLSGKSQEEAIQALNDAGLSFGGSSQQETEDAEPGTVLSSDPAEGTAVAPGSDVSLVIAKGPSNVEVPDLSGLDESQASKLLEEVGLTAEFTVQESEDADPGTAIAQNPTAGTSVAPGTTVTVTMAQAPTDQPTTPAPSGSDDGGGDDGGGWPTGGPSFPPDPSDWGGND